MAVVKTPRSVEQWLVEKGELVQMAAEAHSAVVELFALALVAAVVVVTAQTVGAEAGLGPCESVAAVVLGHCSALLVQLTALVVAAELAALV